MKITNHTPREDGFYMPAEYAPQHGCILIWPERPGSWPYEAKEARKTFLRLIKTLAKGEEVFLLVSKKAYGNAYKNVANLFPSDSIETLSGNMWVNEECEKTDKGRVQTNLKTTILGKEYYPIHLLEMENDDAWARDTGPTFITNGQEVRGINWSFNAWGGQVDGLYANWEKDDQVAASFCDQMGYDYYDASPFVLEGGSIHSDGQGTILVTESCLLSAGRNPSMTKKEIEQKLCEYLGAKKVIWLPYGIYQDETNEHVDNVCAFVGPAEVVLAWTEDESDPQYAMSQADYEVLTREKDALGRTFTVHKMLTPEKHVCITEEVLAGLEAEEGEDEREVGERLAASYVNFYIGNQVVLVPQFGDVNDQKAILLLSKCFKDRKVVPIPARSLIVGGGNIHCITQQVPAINGKKNKVSYRMVFL